MYSLVERTAPASLATSVENAVFLTLGY